MTATIPNLSSPRLTLASPTDIVCSFSVSQSTLAKGHFNITSKESCNISNIVSIGGIKLELKYAPLGPSNYVLTSNKGVNLASVKFRSKATTAQANYQVDLSNSCNIAWDLEALAIEIDESGDHLPRLKITHNQGKITYYRWTPNHPDLDGGIGLINLTQPTQLIATYELPSKASSRGCSLDFFSALPQQDLTLFILFLAITLSTSSMLNSNPSSPEGTPSVSRSNTYKGSVNSRTSSTSSIKSNSFEPISPLNTRKSSEVLMGGEHLW